MERVEMKCYAIRAVLLGLTVSAVQADTLTVDDDGTADFTTIQAAVDAAIDGDTIVVYPGTYSGGINTQGLAIELVSSELHAAIVDGGATTRGFTCDSNETSETEISGFLIRDCHVGDNGGGMLLRNSSPTITNCRFVNNAANHAGGVFAENSSSTWNNCEFDGNGSGDGGGAYFTSGSVMIMTGCTFTDNSGNADGGAIRVFGNSSLDISLSMFDGNSVTGGNARGGAIQVDVGSTLIATLCTFNNNQSAKDGGAIEVSGWSSNNLILDQCTFIDNSAIDGGGIFCEGMNPTLTNCTFTNNASSEDGGAIFCESSDPTLFDCIFTSNSAREAGALRLENNSNAVVTNCLFNFNTATIHAGASYALSGGATFLNCAFIGNSAADKGGAILIGSTVHIESCFFGDNIAGSGGALYLNNNSAYVSSTRFCNNIPEHHTGSNFNDKGGNTFDDFCSFDCNENGIDDVEDIANQTSFDCDGNGVPDECQPDCDGDGWIDACDNEGDCDDDGIPDNCELDCNGNGIPDGCDIIFGISEDCNENGVPDECDITTLDGVTNLVQWKVEDGGNGHWYGMLVLAASQSAEGHFAIAESLGGYTATMHSAEENLLCYNIGVDVGHHTAFIGVRKGDNNQGGWITGEPWTYSNWHSGEGQNSWERYANLWGPQGDFNEQWQDTDGTPGTHSIIEFDSLQTSTSEDCNGNGIPDECDLADDPSLDCDGDGIFDSCAINDGIVDDCNYNEIPDNCDITDGTSNDVNMNGVPDECETDCNENGIPDDWEIKNGLVLDCNENMLPDECDIADGTSTDVNSNDVPDECEDDCNGNGIPDDWDIKTGAALDCNGNGIPDYCDVAAGCDADCNVNGIPDSCEIANGTSEDINANNVLDECECIADISGDGVVDIDDILALIGYWGSPGPLGDLNADGIVSIHDLLILVAGWGECTNVPCSPPMAGAVQWTIEEGGNGHWYAFMPAYISWTDARIDAESLGGYLCCMETVEEWNWLHDELLEPNSDVLFADGGWGVIIGGIQTDQSNEPYGGWEWITGTPFECNIDFNCNMENYLGVQHVMSLVREAGMPIQFNDIDTVPDQPFYMIEFE
ncbi:MAG: putative outer membrane repeat protein [Phycisphaerales bacterium]|jgi:predicted outer membrane repeat protein